MDTKKILTTTALISLFASTALADGYVGGKSNLDIKFGGEADVQMGFNIQEQKYKSSDVSLTPNNNEVAFDSRASLYLEASGRTSKGLKYGAHLGFMPTIFSRVNSAKHFMDRSYIFVEDKDLGRVEFGSNEGAADQLMLGAGSIAAATGGVNGDWFKYVQTSPTTGQGNFILNPAMPLDNNLYYAEARLDRAFFMEKSRKLTYLSSKIEGFQLGVSYIPDVANTGSSTVINTTAESTLQENNAVSGGVKWEGKFQKDHLIKASLVGEYGKVKSGLVTGLFVQPEDTKALAVGLTWHFKEFAAAGSFGYLGDTDYRKDLADSKKAWFATLGAGMEFNKFYASLTGMYSEKNDNKAYVVAGGVDYELAPGFLPYAEVIYADLDGKNMGGTNLTNGNFSDDTLGLVPFTGTDGGKSSGVALILGTKVKF